MAQEITIPSEARRALLAEHTRVRNLVDELVLLAERAAAGEHLGRRFAAVVGQLLRTLETHNASEEATMAPLLRGPDAERMLAEHRDEHAALLAVLDASDEEALARTIPSFAADLYAHIEREESGFLASDALAP